MSHAFRECVRGGVRVVPFLLILITPVAVLAAAPPALRIGVASFEGEAEGLSVSEALADRLATRSLDRLIPPKALCGPESRLQGQAAPEASTIREWAYNASVDTVIVGRVRTPEGEQGPVDVAVGVRSGHSGAPLAEYEVRISNRGELDAGTEALASEILDVLGYVPQEPAAADEPPREAGASSSASGSEAGLDRGLSLGELSEDEPIRIESDELEVSAIGKTRHLIFTQNVRVAQGTVRLTSNRLEAFYAEGESQPEKLIAQGRVRVVQSDRVARCDRATYRRSPERITCEGHAELEQGCDVVRGDAIEFDLTSDRARVVGAASVVIRPEVAESGACAASEGRP